MCVFKHINLFVSLIGNFIKKTGKVIFVFFSKFSEALPQNLTTPNSFFEKNAIDENRLKIRFYNKNVMSEFEILKIWKIEGVWYSLLFNIFVCVFIIIWTCVLCGINGFNGFNILLMLNQSFIIAGILDTDYFIRLFYLVITCFYALLNILLSYTNFYRFYQHSMNIPWT